MMPENDKIRKKIASLNKSHPPSYSRGLKRTAKYILARKGNITPIIVLARKVDDKFYRADIIGNIAYWMAEGNIPGSHKLFLESLEYIKYISPKWRQIEAFENLLKAMEKAKDYEFSQILRYISSIQKSKFRIDMSKKAIKILFKGGVEDLGPISDWIDNIYSRKERARINGYVGEILLKKGDQRGKKFLLRALSCSDDLENEEETVSVLMGLIGNFERSKESDFNPLYSAAKKISGRKSKAELLGNIGGKMHKLGIMGFEDVFQEAMDHAGRIHNENVRLKITQKINRGMIKAGLGPPIIEGKQEIESREFSSKDSTDAPFIPSGLKITIGLYNTYDTRIHKAHMKAIERAGTMCYTLGIPLVLLDFPFEDIPQVLDYLKKDNSLKAGAKYIRILADSDSILLVDLKEKGVLGKIVATTSKPDKKKMITLGDALLSPEMLCIVMGLGRKGLPRQFLDSADYHLEFTGRNIPLETCAAMGVLGGKIIGELSRNQESF